MDSLGQYLAVSWSWFIWIPVVFLFGALILRYGFRRGKNHTISKAYEEPAARADSDSERSQGSSSQKDGRRAG